MLKYSYILGDAYDRLKEIRKAIDHYKFFTNFHGNCSLVGDDKIKQ